MHAARASTPETVPLTPGGWLLGSLPEMKRDILAFTEKAYAACGDLALVSGGPPGLRFELLMVNHPEGAARVLAGSNWTNFRKEGGLYDEIRTLLGNGILTSQDEDWVRQRRFVQPRCSPARTWTPMPRPWWRRSSLRSAKQWSGIGYRRSPSRPPQRE